MTSKDSTCIVCENQFKNKSKDKKFCSMPCYRIAQKRGDYIGTKGTKLKYNCAHCAKEVLGKSKSTNRKGEHSDKIFCDRNCYDSFRSEIRNKIIGNCKNCGSELSRAKIKNNSSVYCSMTCRVVDKKPLTFTSICKICSVEFCGLKLVQGRVRKDRTKTTCSRDCYIQDIKTNKERKEKIALAFRGSKHPAWQGGKSYHSIGGFRGVNWKSIRLTIIERDKFKCVQCGMNREDHYAKYNCDFNVNHIKPFHQFGGKTELANKPSNLETLCKSCHTKTDAAYRKNNQIQMILF